LPPLNRHPGAEGPAALSGILGRAKRAGGINAADHAGLRCLRACRAGRRLGATAAVL